MLEGLTLGALLCSLIANYTTNGMSFGCQELSAALQSGELPKNHHIQRAVRRAFLKASLYQISRYFAALEAGGCETQDDIVQAYCARQKFRWKVLKSRWSNAALPASVTQMDIIDGALDEVAPSAPQEALGEYLRKYLTDAAIAEILAETHWQACPQEFYEQMHHEKLGWYPGFAAMIAHVLKTDDQFRHIHQALNQRSVQHMQEAIRGFQLAAHANIAERLGSIEEAISDNKNLQGLEERLLNSEAAQTETLLIALKEAPFGRQYLASEAKGLIALRIRHLTEFFAGRDRDFTDIDNFVTARMAGRNKGLMIITAPAGFGKSALAAAWCEYAVSDPDIDVALHFCSASQSGRATTDPTKVLGHLLAQISATYDERPDHSDPYDAIISLLQKPLPQGRRLVIWLDGLDEADAEIRPFIPPAEKLAERVCVIVSARAEPGSTPSYLRPWRAGDLAETYEPMPVKVLEKLPIEDVEELAVGYFQSRQQTMPSYLPGAIFEASDKGYTIFVRYMVEDSLNAIAAGKSADLGQTPHSLANYASSELHRLYKIDTWREHEAHFQLLTVLRGAIEQKLVAQCSSSGYRFNAHALPDELRRWLSISPPNIKPATVGFAHPKLAEVFRCAIEKDGDGRFEETLSSLLEGLENKPSAMSEYALLHLPFHMLDGGLHDEASDLLMDVEFIGERFERLGVETAADLMAEDWRAFYLQQSKNQ